MESETGNMANRPRWVDLATDDPQGAQQFYGQLFGWQMEVSDDPQYGGYAIGNLDGRGAAGIGSKQDPSQPTVWSLYIGTDYIEGLVGRITEEGGTVVAPPFDVGNQGRMAIFQDSAGAFISAWQGSGTSNFISDRPGAFSWAELNARDVTNVIPFYERVFDWTTRTTDGGDQPYHEFQRDGQSVLGALEMPPELPAEVPAYWLIYFDVEDVDSSFQRAVELGATEVVGPQEFPGGRFAIVSDPQGATFGLLKVVNDV
jgi:predicted enzyme related to lactoylglutathione lyase